MQKYAVNQHGGLGHWAWKVPFDPIEPQSLISKHG